MPADYKLVDRGDVIVSFSSKRKLFENSQTGL